MADQLYCGNCRKTMGDTNFYQYKDGSKCELCKTCLTMYINNFEPDTFLWLLEKFDVPYVESEWNVLRDRAYAKDPIKFGPMSVFGRYLSKMKLKQWKNFYWADTEKLKLEAEEKAKLYGGPNQKSVEDLEQMRVAHENGEISDAQYQTYVNMNKPDQEFEFDEATKQIVAKGSAGSAYPINDNPFEQVELPDVGNDLTEDDKIYLALKWGRLYSAADWVWLEKKYESFTKDYGGDSTFDEARKDQLLFICKTSLKMNQALDAGDIDTYQKLSKVYDAHMKAGKFTEAQKKEEKAGEFDCVGSIVLFCEKEGGFIPSSKIEVPLDIADKDLMDMKHYYDTLIKEDTLVAKQIEEYIKKRDILKEQEEDEIKAKELGVEYLELTDEDFSDYNNSIEQQIDDDINEEESFSDES